MNKQLARSVHKTSTGITIGITNPAAAAALGSRLCPNCLCYVTTPVGESHCMSDEEWESYIDDLVAADNEMIGPKRDALHDWLS